MVPDQLQRAVRIAPVKLEDAQRIAVAVTLLRGLHGAIHQLHEAREHPVRVDGDAVDALLQNLAHAPAHLGPLRDPIRDVAHTALALFGQPRHDRGLLPVERLDVSVRDKLVLIVLQLALFVEILVERVDLQLGDIRAHGLPSG